MVADIPEPTHSAHRKVGDGGPFVVWLVWGALLCGGLLAGNLPLDDASGWSEWGRLGSSVLLVVAAWLFFLRGRATAASRYLLLIAIGMTLGALGDFFMAGRLQTLIKLPNPALGGIAAFGLGHAAYIAACLDAHKRAGLKSRAARWEALLIWQLIGLVGWYFIVYPTEVDRLQLLRWPALVYTLLLACTAGMAMSLAVQDRRFSLLTIGAALFLLSDLILAWGMFHGSFPYSREAVWIPYGGGQMLIVYATTTARAALCGTKQ
ncbi:YhhN-like protein [Symmachiella dynata]|uniref:YhhN-like protein n=1 Tax=Symmachiella dynata TaxID=2527995 RepID=A0A517ZJS3_9PLAN|nr:lysoplasmalogenase [Symmachiella dynata]QDU42735.1 YhhN-like protein [Symmachiella dynata]